ncbi:elongation factor Ts [Candidatus Parcubacteria bacterium]|nr:elongation factor Ts [Candidatus Parcubacteria bacterium]
MMEITTEQIKELRDATGVSIMQCKKALEEAEGDMDKAKVILSKASAKSASKKSDRELGAGVVSSYIHAGGSVGSMVELLCETDFVSKNEEFQELAREIAMQVAATDPEYITGEEIDDEIKAKATEIFAGEAEGKPEDIKAKIIEGKLESHFGEKTLLKQSYIKDPEKTVNTLIEEGVQKFGEKIQIGRISRFAILQ